MDPVRPVPRRQRMLHRWPLVVWVDAAHRKSPGLLIEFPHPVALVRSADQLVVRVSMRSVIATGSSQWGQVPPRPTRVQGWLHPWHNCWPW